MNSPVFLGAGGRVARLIAPHWPGNVTSDRPSNGPIGIGRTGPDMIWDMAQPPPPLPQGDGRRAMICFAGVTPLGGGDLSRNTDLALAALAAARIWGMAHVFFCSSSAVYGDPGPDPVGETAPTRPTAPYGQAKLTMERAVLGETGPPGMTILRLGNVAGAGQPFDAARDSKGRSLPLHRFADRTGPSRSFIGPRALAHVLHRLCRHVSDGTALPPVLNVAAPRPTAMADILDRLDQPWHWVPATPGAIPRVHLETGLLQSLCPLPDATGTPAGLLDELPKDAALP